MIKGIGIDLVEVDRIKKAADRDGFIQKYFTSKEIAMFQEHKMHPLKIAGNFSTKEAVVKVLGTGFGKIKPVDIEVLRDNKGKPYVVLYGHAKVLSKEMEISCIHVSISNTKTHVTAVAIGEEI